MKSKIDFEREEFPDIDLVYLWVDGSDPVWLAKKEQITGVKVDQSEENNKGRYINNDELRYSLRSVEKNIPWIRKIYIVTDNQSPPWLQENDPKIEIVDHKDILPEEALPCFNSSVIEYFLYKIPGLSEHFLFANDDMFFNNPLSPGFFFGPENKPFVRLKKKFFRKWHYPIKRLMKRKLGQYITMVVEGALLVEKKFGVYYSGVPHHNVDAYVKSDYRKAVEEVFNTRVKKSLSSHIRMYGDMHRSTFAYYFLAVDRAIVKYVRRKESIRIPIYKSDFERYLEKYQPDLFCLNDNQRVTDDDRARVKPLLESYFPEKSRFEK